MNNVIIWSGGLATTLIALIWYYPTLFYIFSFVLYSAILIVIAVTGTIYIHFTLSSKTQPQQNHQPLNVLYNATKSSIFDPPNPIKNSSNLPLIFGRTVDLQLQQIIEYALRDFVSPWLGYVVIRPKNLTDVLREDIWNAVQKLRERTTKIDSSKMIAVDMVNRVTVHLEKIRISEARATETGTVPVFATNSYIQTEERELEFLRKLTEIIIIFLLPRGYSLSPLKILLSEVISYKLLFPMIKIITSPDYINQKIVQYIESRLAAAAINKRTYEYAAGFEELLKIINTSNLDDLSLIRTSIINDLMQATTMQNLQRAKGLDPDTDDNYLSRSERSAAVRLKRFVQQLNFAKIQCEKNLTKLGWDGHFTNDLNLSLMDILSTVVGRRYLTLFLEPLKASALVGFYSMVEELKHASKSAWHQLGAEIFYAYIRVPQPEIPVDKTDRKKIEQFLLGDSGPEVFYDIQKCVLHMLEEKYYPSFLLSEQYNLLRESLTSDDIKDISSTSSLESQEDQVNSIEIAGDGSMDLTNHSTYARNKLEQIQERLDNKNQALEALKSSVKPESKVLSILEKEVDWLKGEKRQIESHLMRTEAWSEHLGKWKATIQNVEFQEDTDSLQFTILVHVDENLSQHKHKTDLDSITSGWVVMRSLAQFHELQRKLRPLSSELKTFDLPTTFKMFFLKNDKSSLEKAKGQIQKYLNFILEDDHLNQSETIYTFLSPSSEHLKQVTPSPKKSKFSLATFFKTDSTKTDSIKSASSSDPFWGLTGCRDDDDNMSMYLEGSDIDINSKQADLDSKDSIAEPLYALLGEIFDMGGVFKWVRKSLISFVQITYGRTINRQIRESINYLFEESMLHFYASTISKSFWPGGVLASSYPVRSDDMKEMTTNAAKALLIDNIPEVLCNLVGAQTAKRGALKVFEVLQNPIYNKQLFYELLEIVMLELFPEIRQLKPNSIKHHSNHK